MRVRCFAKINLTLDVFSKRADGYHSIATVLQTIAMHDRLELAPLPERDIRFTCDAPEQPDVPSDATNLVMRAAHLLWQQGAEKGHEPQQGVRLHLEKRIPSQAGLGGGSSDAAMALWALNRYWGMGLEQDQLLKLALKLGSDVPFFLLGGTAVARGRGEQIAALPDIPPLWLVVVKPDVNISTSWAYEALDALPNRRSNRATQRMENAIGAKDRERILAFQCNDFEAVVFERFPQLAWLCDEMRMAGALASHLCGSGSAVYGIFASQAAAMQGADLLNKRYRRVFLTHTLTRERAEMLRLEEGNP